jgi:hypothetical protein
LNLNDLLREMRITPRDALVLRHAPQEPKLRENLEALATSNHELYNAYQQTQTPAVENKMMRAKFVVSCVGHEPGKARVIGIYAILGHRPIPVERYWDEPLNAALRDQFKLLPPSGTKRAILWFDLVPLRLPPRWTGRPVIKWPAREINWSRWAVDADFPVVGGMSPDRMPDEDAAPDHTSSKRPPYIPQSDDARETTQRQIRERRGQHTFREDLRRRYGTHCLVTGSAVLAVLEAAHIRPYRGPNDNHPENGLLLRADIHTLFDLHLIQIDPETLTVHLHADIADSPDYATLHGRPLRVPAGMEPSREALRLRYEGS